MIVHGRVQGVGFRVAVQQRVRSAGVTGWVRNLPDGTVEALFEGDPVAVERLVAFVHTGPRGARVDRVEVFEES